MNAHAYADDREADAAGADPGAQVDEVAQARASRRSQQGQADDIRSERANGAASAPPDGASAPERADAGPGAGNNPGDAQAAAPSGPEATPGGGETEPGGGEAAPGGGEAGPAAGGAEAAPAAGEAATEGAGEAGGEGAPGAQTPGAGASEATAGAQPAGGAAGGGGGAAGGGGGGAGGGGAGGDVELQMPEAPESLDGDEQARLEAANADMGSAGGEAGTLPAGEQSAADARGAVTEPEDETAGRAEVALTQALDDKPSPSAEILELCDRIRKAIRDKRPPDEDSLVDADPEAMAKAAGDTLQADVKGDAERVQGEYAGMDEAPAGQPAQTPTAYETADPAVTADGGDATQAAPDPIPEEDFSLDADVQEQAQAMEEAGMETEPAQLVEDGPIGAARDAQGELEEEAVETPAELNARQAEAIATAQTDMAALQTQALAALQASRAQTVGSTGGRQGQMVGSEEQMRAQAGQRMRQIFTDAKSQVTTLLEPLSTNAMAKWDAGVAQYATDFKTSLAEVDRIIEERHDGILGGLVSLKDSVFGLPDEIVALYDKAEKKFGDDVCALITKISEEVNGVIAACEAIIANARTQIDAVVDSLPDELKEWATGEAATLNEELDTLQSDVQKTQQDFTQDLCERAAGAVQEVREEVHSRREAAKGIIGRIADAIAEFLEDPFRAIVNGLLSLAGIDPGAFWAMVDKLGDVVQAIADDPIGFAKTFMGAVGDGFKQFFDNIVTHLGNGFFEWITGGLASVGVQIPPDFSLGSIVTLCLQVMGLTWDRIKQVLGKHIGEDNVELLDKAIEFIGTFMQQGPAGLFEMLKDHFDPSQLVGMVKDAAMQWLIEKVVQKAVVKLLSMLNPAGAIVQAVLAIYDAVTWLFENAAKIFKVVEAIVNGAADLIAGNTAALAGKVELALAGMIAPAIDFVAELIGLGDLPDKIAGIIRDLQDWVLGVVDTAIGWIAKHVRGLLKKLGVGGDEEEEEGGDEGDGEIGKTVRFSADAESHRLWVDTSNSQPELMVASTPMPVSERLAHWESDLTEKEKDDSADMKAKLTKYKPRSTISAAKSHLDGTKTLAKKTSDSEAAGDDKTANENDKKTEDSQSELVKLLKPLFEFFGQEFDLADHPVYDHLGQRFIDRTKTPTQVLINPAETGSDGNRRLPDYGLRTPSQASPYIYRYGKTEGLPTVSLDDEGKLVEGESSADPMAHLDKDAICRGLTRVYGGVQPNDLESLSKAEDKTDNPWVAVFATGGRKLVTTDNVDLTLDVIFQETGTEEGFRSEMLAAVQQNLMSIQQRKPDLLKKGQTVESLAEGIVSNVLGSIRHHKLAYVDHTKIPRTVPQSSDYVKTREGAKISPALYGAIASEAENEASHKLGEEVHHVLPLYLGGSHVEGNLLSVIGKASQDVAQSAHAALHRLIDGVSITGLMEDNVETLSYRDLSRAFAKEPESILIGTLHLLGDITYQTLRKKAKSSEGS